MLIIAGGSTRMSASIDDIDDDTLSLCTQTTGKRSYVYISVYYCFC